MNQPNQQNNIIPSAQQKWLYVVMGIVLLLVFGTGVWWYVSLRIPPQESKKELASQDQTADWKTYRNEEFGFEFRYSPKYAIGETTLPNDITILAMTSEMGTLVLEKHVEWESGFYTADSVFGQVRFEKDMPYEIGEKPLLTTYAVPNFATPRYMVRVMANQDGTDFVAVKMNTDKLDQFLNATDLLFSEFKFLFGDRGTLDKERIVDLRMVQTGLELYFTAKNSYPIVSNWEGLEKAVNSVGVQTVPYDNLHSYQYGVSGNGSSFVIGALLDNFNDPVLLDDVDGVVYGVNCDDPVYCVYNY